MVLGRKSGNKWYIAGINSTDKEKTISLSLDLFKGKKATCILNGKGEAFFDQKIIAVKPGKKETVSMAAHDGFVMVVE
ncbi:glycoside hydrolase family 97 C-terminal domain-containing protein [Terrimonas pollutisoli]|uniref:glycoside hydrolase family 97 C-terminal domain-containing protein n=1 Tax=Terrimonas pollutisoli TaxID=3034147 RepID=UPI0023ECD22A|nr:glycoside hydrolase family 97 C-terminal domain-containing protein [Terrimonas sp. H1YJ31]